MERETMKKILKYGLFFGLMTVFVGATDGLAATTKTKKQAALQSGTKVRAKVEAKDIYDQECFDKYFGCMDAFCIADNENGGTCMCSDDAAKYDEQLEAIKKTLAEAERISTEEVERIQAGANADIIFNNGERIYNTDGDVTKVTTTKKKATSPAASNSLSWLFGEEDDEDEDEWEDIDMADKVGRELYESANELCKKQMPSSCNKDMTILTQLYSRQIVSDCKGLANSIAQKKSEADTVLKQAKAAVRGALRDSLEESNQYDRGTCMVEYKKCMKSEDACGSDWSNCVFTIAAENMQNNAAVNVAGTMVDTINVYDITASTMEILESKRYICEKVLDKCMAVRQYVWNDFLREAAPTIRLAEQNVESQKRQSCLGDISACIQKACKDDIVGKGTATMDSCLSRPDMARSFCKVQIDPCERMEPQIWDYVVAKLAAMRVDACTAEVKECFTSEDRCGPDFANCIGMDFRYIHDICPIDKLVVCKKANPNFKMSDLDSMLMGLYLNIDNKALENCQNLAEQKMVELCGSTTDCNAFAADEYLGTNSVRSQKDGTTYRVTGMISFGSIKMGDATGSVKDGNKVLAPGEIGVDDYIKQIKKLNKSVPNADAIISSIEAELKNIAGTINRTISLIESDQRVQYCINGRDLSQINGKDKKDNKTEARFPNLLNQYRVMIGMSALRKAQDNYNKKVNQYIAEATQNASADVAQYMCQKIADARTNKSIGNEIIEQTPLTAPYSISYDVGAGLLASDLVKGGSGSSNVAMGSFKNGGYLGGLNANMGGVMKDVTSTFDRETRNCHVCTTVTTQSCKTTGSSSWFHNNRNQSCDTIAKDPFCEDIQM
jgi:hypothetical protein